MVTSEWTARSIGAMHAGRQSDNQQPGRCITKGLYRPGMVVRVFSRHLAEKTGEPGA
jgi:hypothetical protein